MKSPPYTASRERGQGLKLWTKGKNSRKEPMTCPPELLIQPESSTVRRSAQTSAHK